MFVLCIVVIIGILFAVSLYLYENSQFSKITGYSYFSLWNNNKIRYTYKLSRLLKKVNGEHKILFNLVLPSSGRKIDALLIHKSGLYVIHAKQLGGWIYGNEKDIHWAQVLQRDRLNKFNNPIIENKLRIIDLKQNLPEVNKELYHSLIVFDGSCSFKKIEIYSNFVDVVKTHELKSLWKMELEERLTKEDINKVYKTLEPYMTFNAISKEAPLKVTTN